MAFYRCDRGLGFDTSNSTGESKDVISGKRFNTGKNGLGGMSLVKYTGKHLIYPGDVQFQFIENRYDHLNIAPSTTQFNIIKNFYNYKDVLIDSIDSEYFDNSISKNNSIYGYGKCNLVKFRAATITNLVNPSLSTMCINKVGNIYYYYILDSYHSDYGYYTIVISYTYYVYDKDYYNPYATILLSTTIPFQTNIANRSIYYLKSDRLFIQMGNLYILYNISDGKYKYIDKADFIPVNFPINEIYEFENLICLYYYQDQKILIINHNLDVISIIKKSFKYAKNNFISLYDNTSEESSCIYDLISQQYVYQSDHTSSIDAIHIEQNEEILFLIQNNSLIKCVIDNNIYKSEFEILLDTDLHHVNIFPYPSYHKSNSNVFYEDINTIQKPTYGAYPEIHFHGVDFWRISWKNMHYFDGNFKNQYLNVIFNITHNSYAQNEYLGIILLVSLIFDDDFNIKYNISKQHIPYKHTTSLSNDLLRLDYIDGILHLFTPYYNFMRIDNLFNNTLYLLNDYDNPYSGLSIDSSNESYTDYYFN